MRIPGFSTGPGKRQFGVRPLLLAITAASALFAILAWWPLVGVGTIALLSSISVSAVFGWWCTVQDLFPIVQGIRLVVAFGNVLMASFALLIALIGLAGATDTSARFNMQLATGGASLFALAAISAVALLASGPLLCRRFLVAAGVANSLLLLYVVWSLGNPSEDPRSVAPLYAVALVNANALTLKYVSAKRGKAGTSFSKKRGHY